MFARLYADFLGLSGMNRLRVFDTDHPNGGLQRYFPEISEIVDISRTAGQVRLFDTMIQKPEVNYVVDLQASLLARFFTIFHDIGFDEGAREAGIDIVVFFIVDRSMSSIHAAERLRQRIGGSEFVLVHNEAIGTLLHLPSAIQEYQGIEKDRDLVLPKFSDATRDFVENPDFSFASFIAGGFHKVPLPIRHELWEFLESLYDQRGRGSSATTHLI